MIKTLLTTQQGFNPVKNYLPPRPTAISAATVTDIKLEQALIDLQDMKTTIMRDTVKGGGGSEPMFRQSAFAYTDMNTTTTSEMPVVCHKQQSNTGTSWFMDKTKQQPDQSNKEFYQLTSEQLKERLLIAETIMKRQYARNKELEKQLAQFEN